MWWGREKTTRRNIVLQSGGCFHSFARHTFLLLHDYKKETANRWRTVKLQTHSVLPAWLDDCANWWSYFEFVKSGCEKTMASDTLVSSTTSSHLLSLRPAHHLCHLKDWSNRSEKSPASSNTSAIEVPRSWERLGVYRIGLFYSLFHSLVAIARDVKARLIPPLRSC